MRLLRWFLLIPAAIAAWYAVAAMGLFAYSYVERNLCPPEDVISGFCYNAHIQRALTIIMHVFVGVSAIAVSVTATVVTPFHKETIVWATLVVGDLIAAYFSLPSGHWSLFLAAALSGLLGAVAIVFLIRVRATENSLQANSADRA